jgi:hypothetical protein
MKMIVEVEFKYKRIDRRVLFIIENKLKRFSVQNIVQTNHNMKDKIFTLNIVLKYECNMESVAKELNEIPNIEVIAYNEIESKEPKLNKRRKIVQYRRE